MTLCSFLFFRTRALAVSTDFDFHNVKRCSEIGLEEIVEYFVSFLVGIVEQERRRLGSREYVRARSGAMHLLDRLTAPALRPPMPSKRRPKPGLSSTT